MHRYEELDKSIKSDEGEDIILDINVKIENLSPTDITETANDLFYFDSTLNCIALNGETILEYNDDSSDVFVTEYVWKINGEIINLPPNQQELSQHLNTHRIQ